MITDMIQGSVPPESGAHDNPPGLPEIAYRMGTYTTVLERLKAYLAAHRQQGGNIRLLNLQADGSWAVGLLEAWAMIVDIITFYQERIANEGYLRTATELRSVQELAKAIGYEPQPGVAASTYLAFTVREVAGEPARRSSIPKGTAVQSVPSAVPRGAAERTARQQPDPAQLPQIFETSESFEARTEWNLLRPATDSFKSTHSIRRNITTLRLAGTSTGIRAGDAILIVGDAGTDPAARAGAMDDTETRAGAMDAEARAGAQASGAMEARAQASGARTYMFVFVKEIEVNRTRRYTQVSWDANEADAQRNALILRPQVFLLKQKAALYPYPRSGTYYAPLEDARDWSPSSIGLPATAVHALLLHKNGCLFAGTDSGVYRSANNGETWEAAKSGLMSTKTCSLALSEDGRMYAGSMTGNVFCSMDDGETWKMLVSRPPLRTKLLGFAVPGQTLAAVSLPKSPVRKIYPFVKRQVVHLAVAMDDGVFVSADHGATWSKAFSGASAAKEQAAGGAWSFAPGERRGKVLVGVDTGVVPLKLPHTLPPWWGSAIVGLVLGLIVAVLAVLGSQPQYVETTASIPLIGGFLLHYVARYAFIIIPVLLALLLALLVLAAWWFILNRIRSGSSHPGGPVRALLARQHGELFAGTGHGIFRAPRHDRGWRLVTQGPMKQLFRLPSPADNTHSAAVDLPAQTLEHKAVPDSLREVFSEHEIALSQQATLVVEGNGTQWRIVDNEKQMSYVVQRDGQGIAVSRLSDVRMLLADERGRLFAGTQDGEIFCSKDDGEHWESHTPTPFFSAVEDAVLHAGGVFAAGSLSGSGPDSQWSRFQVEGGQFFLDKLYPGIEAGNWLVLHQGEQAALYKTTATTSAASGDGSKKNSRVTRVDVEHAGSPGGYDRSQAALCAQSAQLTLYNDEPVEDNLILLDGLVPGLTSGHHLIVSGKRPRVRVTAENGGGWLVSADGLQAIPFVQGDSYVLMAKPTTAQNATLLSLQDREGFVGQISVDAGAIIMYEPARDDDETLAEVVDVLAIQQRTGLQEYTLVTLAQPLQRAYDRSTVSICANVVYATHGQTVAGEVLNSIDPAKGQQYFMLKQKPLTYVPATTPAGIACTLVVQVNQVRWHEITDVQALSTAHHAYLLRRDSYGNAAILFGKRSHGSHVLGGAEQVTATYRVGIGEVGNVPAQSLTTLRTRPAGIQRVTNPLAAAGGTEPEGLEQMRARAPQQIRTLQRIVSLRDYEEFAYTFGGIGKFQARSLWDGRTRIVCLTLAGANGEVIQQTSVLHNDLLAAINAAAAAPSRNVQIAGYEPLYFQVQARLVLDADWIDQQAAIIASATQALTTAFGFERRDLGQGLAAAEVIATLQEIRGVSAVELERLYLRDARLEAEADVDSPDDTLAQSTGTEAIYNEWLEAKSGRLEAGKFLPAQLLMINATSEDGIVLFAEEAKR